MANNDSYLNKAFSDTSLRIITHIYVSQAAHLKPNPGGVWTKISLIFHFGLRWAVQEVTLSLHMSISELVIYCPPLIFLLQKTRFWQWILKPNFSDKIFLRISQEFCKLIIQKIWTSTQNLSILGKVCKNYGVWVQVKRRLGWELIRSW